MKANATLLLQTAVANAVKTALSSGAGAKKLAVYSGAIPENAGEAVTAQVKLIEFAIDPATWTVVDGELIVPASAPVDAIATGVARWARFIDGNDEVVMDVDVTASGGNGFVRLTSALIISGVQHSVVSGSIQI